MTPQERRRRALDRGLLLAKQMSRVASATWLVPSQSDPGGVHAVALIDGYLRCDCFAALADHPCAHKAAVSLVLLAGPVRGAQEQEPDAPAAPDVRWSA